MLEEAEVVVMLIIFSYLLGMGFFNYFFIPRGVTYHTRTHVAFLYYVTCATLLLLAFGTFYLNAVLEIQLKAKIALSILAIVLAFTPLLIQLFPSYSRLSTAYPRAALLSFHYPYVFAKTGEIFFQQICVVLLTLFLFEVLEDVYITMGVYAAIFALIHVPLFLVLKPFFAAAFTGAALISGLVIPPVVLLIEDGVVYSFVIHWGFYIFFTYGIHFTKGWPFLQYKHDAILI